MSQLSKNRLLIFDNFWNHFISRMLWQKPNYFVLFLWRSFPREFFFWILKATSLTFVEYKFSIVPLTLLIIIRCFSNICTYKWQPWKFTYSQHVKGTHEKNTGNLSRCQLKKGYIFQNISKIKRDYLNQLSVSKNETEILIFFKNQKV